MEDTNDRITLVGGNQNAHAFSMWAGLQNPDVQSGPIALELWLYNNPLFTYTAEAVKTANRFFNGRQMKHPCRARAPSPRQERRVKSAPWLLSSSELRWHEYGVCAITVIKWVQPSALPVFSLMPRFPSVWIGMHMVLGERELLWNISLERFQFTHHKIAEQCCKQTEIKSVEGTVLMLPWTQGEWLTSFTKYGVWIKAMLRSCTYYRCIS